MRGKACLCITCYRNLGITPAYAGKSAGVANTPLEIKDHPRLCGEKMLHLQWSPEYLGSPPPMRGKVIEMSIVRPRFWDHPRLCGEKYCRIPQQQQDIGSPPPMRGKDLQGSFPCQDYRITPAYAGKSISHSENIRRTWDHPRLCGEKFSVHLNRHFSEGSPPPMRGKGQRFGSRYNAAGITPAYAGKSGYRYTFSILPVGSPPPMRGKGAAGTYFDGNHGITPAYAGKRSVRVSLLALAIGSPPPMRGKGTCVFT